MLTSELIRSLLPWLIALPVGTAIVLRLLPAGWARRFALTSAIAHAAVTLLLIGSGAYQIQSDDNATAKIDVLGSKVERVFIPQFVPGDPMPDGRPSYSTDWDIVGFPANRAISAPCQFFIGLDGLNVWLVALTSIMMVPVVLFSIESISDREGSFYCWLFLLQAGVLGVFLSFDILLFYVCFELTLVPLLFLIGGWGTGPNRREAVRKLFLFTLAGGLITLLGLAGTVIFIHAQTGVLTFSIPRLAELAQCHRIRGDSAMSPLWLNTQTYLFLAMATGFAIKIPLVPLHTWLPGAYSEAPTPVTVMLSALLAKMGLFGFVRICLPLTPDASLNVGYPVLGTCAVVGIIYGAFCAYAQSDFRRLIAYSSVSHLGLCALAILSCTATGLAGGVLHMVNHGLATGAMFLVAGMLVRRYSSAQISDYSGMWSHLPVLSFFMIVISLASVGVPGLNNFVSEMLMLGGLFDAARGTAPAFGIIAAFGVFLSAWYTLTMVRRAFFGPVKTPASPVTVSDLSIYERLGIIPLAVLCLLLGLFPQPVLQIMDRDIGRLAAIAELVRASAP